MPVLCPSPAAGALCSPGCETVTDASQEPALSTRTLPSFWAIAAKRSLVLLLAQVTPASGCSEQSVGMDMPTSGTGPCGAASQLFFLEEKHLAPCCP